LVLTKIQLFINKGDIFQKQSLSFENNTYQYISTIDTITQHNHYKDQHIYAPLVKWVDSMIMLACHGHAST